jgi:ariadne-1
LFSSARFSERPQGSRLSASGSSLAQSGAQWNEEDDKVFGGGGNDNNKKGKGGNADYQLLTAAQVMEKPLEMIQEVNELFQIDASVARQLLQHTKWDSEKLVTRYFAGERDKLFAEAKIPLELGSYKKPTGQISCSVCFDSFDADEIFSLPCHHYFCRECYSEYLQVKVNTEGRAAEIQCPAKDCFLLVDEMTAMKLLPAGAVKERYLKLIAKAFVRDNKLLRGCPAPGCGNFAKLNIASKVLPIACLCGEEYCSGCQQTSHRPCECAMMQEWNNKIQSDSESANWLKLYTRACPKCKAMISKDGGCQYMRCQTCNTGFCWLCMGLFDHKVS